MKYLKKTLAVFLSVLTILSIISTATSVFAAEYTDNRIRAEYFDSALSGYLKGIVDIDGAVKLAEKEKVEEVVSEVKTESAGKARLLSPAKSPTEKTSSNALKEAIADLNIDHTRFTLDLGDGENTAYLFSEPISFIDDSGELVYKDTNIESVIDEDLISRGYTYQNGDNDYKMYFSDDSEKGVLLVLKDSTEIKLVPNGDKTTGQSEKITIDKTQTDVFAYPNAYGSDTLLRFLPQLNGIKDEIILEKYNGKNSFEFTLDVGKNTAAINSKGEIEIIDSDKEIVQTFAAPYAYDAVGNESDTDGHYTDCTYALNKVSDGVYDLSVNVPEEFLTSENTVYPVTIDPATGNVMVTNDAGVYSAKADKTYGSEVNACFGKTGTSEYGKGRAMFFFRVPADIKSYAKISSAKLWLRETTGRTATMYVRPYLNKEAWQSTVTWNTQPSHYSTFTYPGKTGLTLGRKNINSRSSDNASVPYWYAFDITNAVRAWTTGTNNKGLKFIAECEAADGDYLWRAFATKEHSTSSYHPYAVISYTNDTTAPTISSVSGNPTTWTKNDVTLTVTATDDVYGAAGVASYSFDNGKTWQTSNSKKFTSNQTVYIKVKDFAGNPTPDDKVKIVKITKIDKTKPTATITFSPTTPTNGDVTATIKLSDNAALKSYKIGSKAAVSISGTPKTFTVTEKYSEDSTVTVTVTDVAGNTATVSKSFTNIDKVKPVIESVSGNPTSWINTDATFNITATDDESGIAAYSYTNKENTYRWQTESSRNLTKNQTVYIYVKDNAGNISDPKIIKITKIDKTPPEVSVSCVATSVSTRINVTASDGQSGLHATAYSYNNGDWTSQNYFDVQTQDAVSIRVRDVAGNIKELSYTPDPIQPIAVTVTPSSGWTNGDVVITVNGTNLSKYKFGSNSWAASNTYSASQNGNVSIAVEDSHQKRKTLNAVEISNIDKANPVISGVTVSKGDWTNGNVYINVTASDTLSGVAAYSINGGSTWLNGSTFTIGENTENIIIAVKDKAGNISYYKDTDSEEKYTANISEATPINITNIDKTKPAAPDIYEENGTVYAFSRSFDFGEETDSPEHLEYKLGENGTWKAYKDALTLVNTYDVTVYARVRDDAGNISNISSFTVKSTLGEYTTSCSDIAYGEGLFLVPFERTYSSTDGWFFSFNANIQPFTNGYVFTDFSGDKHYFIKNGEEKYVSVDGDELEKNVDNYPFKVTYGELECYFDTDGKLASIAYENRIFSYVEIGNKMRVSEDLSQTANNGVTFTDDLINGAEIITTENADNYFITIAVAKSVTDRKIVKYTFDKQWHLLSFADALNVTHSYTYNAIGLLTGNETETIDYSAQGRVKRISQQNGAFVKYTYNDTAANSGSAENIGAVTVSDSRGVTDTLYYADGMSISSSLDNYSDDAAYDPNNISNALTEDTVTDIAYIINVFNDFDDSDCTEENGTIYYTKYKLNDDGKYVAGSYNLNRKPMKEWIVEPEKLSFMLDNWVDYSIIDDIAYMVIEYSYNQNDQKTQELIKTKVNDNFVNTRKIVYYYSGDNITKEICYEWVNDNWYQEYVENSVYDTSSKLVEDSTSYYNNAVNQENSVVSILVKKETNKYDENGNVIFNETYSNEGSVHEEKTLYAYNDNDELIEQITQFKDESGEFVNNKKTTYSYNLCGDLENTSSLVFVNNVWCQTYGEEYEYNQYGSITRKVATTYTNAQTGSWEPVSEETVTEYDIWNQVVKEIENLGTVNEKTTVCSYDILGRMTQYSANGVTVTYSYDSDNRVIAKTENDETTTYTYADNGNLISRTNADGNKALNVYDDYGNLTNHEFNGYSFTYNTLGNILTAKAGSILLASYVYSDDIKQNVLSESGRKNILYNYDSDGKLSSIGSTGIDFHYSHSDIKDFDGNILEQKTSIFSLNTGIRKTIENNKVTVEKSSVFDYSVENVYRKEYDKNSFDGVVKKIGDKVYTLKEEENKDIFKSNGNIDFTKNYVYNEKNELSNTYIKDVVSTDYGYSSNNRVSYLSSNLNNSSKTYSYTYYDNGNIKSETVTEISRGEQGETVETSETTYYTYDSKNQLISAENNTTKWTYNYDNRGNILSKREYTVSVDENGQKSYSLKEGCNTDCSYDLLWKDQLESYNGQEINYLGTVNPAYYKNGDILWNNYGQPVRIRDLVFKYNEDGIRIQKSLSKYQSDDNYTIDFKLSGTNIIEQTDGTTTLYFYYDRNEEVIGFRYNDNNYFYLKNPMGDITDVVDSDGKVVSSYEYDPWGKVISVTGDVDLGNLNPFRYRSYYYDTEIGMYYLQSRYYDPDICRFICCDDVNYIGLTESEVSYNPFAYCGNNPIIYKDSNGKWLETVLDVASIGWSLFDFISRPSWMNLGFLVWDIAAACIPFAPGSYTAKGGKLAVNVASKIDDLKKTKSLTTGTYKSLKKLFKGIKGVEIHHIIEKRFKKLFKKCSSTDLFMSIPLEKSLHNTITQRWRKEFKYGYKYSKITYSQMEKAIKNVYCDMPELKRIALEWFKKNWKK